MRASLSRVYSFTLDDVPLVTRYHSSCPTLFATGDASASIKFFNHYAEDIRGEERQIVATSSRTLGLNAMIYSLDWVDNQILIATSAGRSFLFDSEKLSCVKSIEGHSCSVKTIRSCVFNRNLAVSGGKDGRVLLFDLRTNSPGTLITEVTGERITGAEFFGDERMVLVSHTNSDEVNTLDLRVSLAKSSSRRSFVPVASHASVMRFGPRSHLLNSLQLIYAQMRQSVRQCDVIRFREIQAKQSFAQPECQRKGVCCLRVDQSNIFTALMSHRVLRYDAGEIIFRPPLEFHGFRCGISSQMSVHPSGKMMTLGGEDSIFVWALHGGGDISENPYVTEHAHTMEVNSVDFANRSDYLMVSVSDDHSGFVWRFDPGEKTSDEEQSEFL